MKKLSQIILIFAFINCITIIMPNNLVKASQGAEETTGGSSDSSEGTTTWVQDAVDAASSFMKEDLTETDELGIVNPILKTVRDIVKAVNTILLVLLSGISAISLSITGVRYIASKASPEQEKIAKQNLHTAFKGMFFGFGAYLIWRLAMGLVSLIISGLGSG